MFTWKSFEEISWKVVSTVHNIIKSTLTSLDGLSKLFQEIRIKNTIAELSPEYKKFAEWLRIE
jgi:hypothetical protein